MEKNPATKKGDKIVLIKSNNGAKKYEGQTLTVMTERKKASCSNIIVRNADGAQFTVYYTGPADEFIFATREAQIEFLEKKLSEIKAREVEINSKIEFLKKYETEEDFVADKLESILTAHKNGKTKNSRVLAITEVLKTLKSSDLL